MPRIALSRSNLPSPQASTDENHETPFSLARQQTPVRIRVQRASSFVHERALYERTSDQGIPRQHQSQPHPSTTGSFGASPTYPLVLPTRFASVFKCTRIFRTQRSNKKNRHGKFRALHGADSDDGDDMAKKLTMEIQKFSSMTAHQNQIHQPTNPKHQNFPT